MYTSVGHVAKSRTKEARMREALRDPRYLRMAGGTISVIGGIYVAVLGFLATFIGGLGLFGGGWAGGISPVAAFICGLLLIFLGALSINARGPFPGIMTIICAIIGAVVGGLLITLFMIIPLLGGAMAAVAAQRETGGDTATATPRGRTTR